MARDYRYSEVWAERFYDIDQDVYIYHLELHIRGRKMTSRFRQPGEVLREARYPIDIYTWEQIVRRMDRFLESEGYPIN